MDWAGGGHSKAGATVNSHNALKVSAVYGCVRILAETIASLPLLVYERGPDGTKRRADDHELSQILHYSPSPTLSSFAWRETIQAHVLLWGNGYSEIIRDRGSMSVLRLRPLLPDRTEVHADADLLFYETHDGNGQNRRRIAPDDVLHVPGLAFNGHQGLSPITLAREAVGLSLATEEFGARWFGNGSRPSGILTHPGRLQPEAAQRLRTSWEQAHSGLAGSHKAAVLEEGVTWTSIGIPPEDAQFLETRKFQVAEIARIYRVPLHMLGDLDRATFSNIEHQAIEFVQHTIRPWLVRWEQEINRKLFGVGSRYFAEFLVDGLLRGDIKTRYESYATGRQWGWLSADDIRRLENMNPLPDGQGEDYLVPMNMIPASDVGASLAPTTPPGSSPVADDEGRGRANAIESRTVRMRKRLESAAQRPVRRAAERVTNFEVEQIRSAVREHLETRDSTTLVAWLNKFYDEHRQRWFREMFPVFSDFAAQVSAVAAEEVAGVAPSPASLETFVRSYADAAANRHTEAARGQLLAMIASVAAGELSAALEQRLDEWAEKRPEKIAQRETIRAGSAIAKMVWAAAGAMTIRWVTVGDNCALCRMMNGRIVGREGSFLKPGQTLDPEDGTTQPLRAKHSIGHPPLHPGCDCTIAPG